MVEGPFAANRLAVVVHQDVQPFALPGVEVGHEPALLAVAVFAVQLRRVEEGGCVENFQFDARFFASGGQALFQREIVEMGDRDAGGTAFGEVGHGSGE